MAGAAVVLLTLALFIGVAAYRGSDGMAGAEGTAAASHGPAAEDGRHATAARPPMLEPRFPGPLRVRPPAQPEAITRIVPAPPVVTDVRGVPQPLSIAGGPPALATGERVAVSVSFYYCAHSDGTPRGDGGGFCGLMRNGSVVFPGAAACHVDYLGQVFRIEGDPTARIYRCADTGSAIDGLHRDIWFESSAEAWAWQRGVGPVAVIEILP